MKNFVDELKWRGMIHDVTPSTSKFLEKNKTSGYIGFDPTADPSQRGKINGNSDMSILGLAIMYSVVPSLFKISTLPFIWKYPLTEGRQIKIRGYLDRKERRLADKS